VVTALIAEAVVEGAAGNHVQFNVSRSSWLKHYLNDKGQPDTLSVHYAESNLTAKLPTTAGADRHTIAVASSAGFRVGEQVTLQENVANSQPLSWSIAVAAIPDTKTVVLATDVPGNQTFNNFRLRSVDLEPGLREVLVEVPGGVKLGEAVPVGTVVQLALTGTTDVRVVQSAGDGAAGPTITLAVGLRRKFELSATAIPAISSLEWDLNITAPAGESFAYLSMQPENANYWGTQVNSSQIRLLGPDPPPSTPSDDLRPNTASFGLPVPARRGGDDEPGAAWLALRDPSEALKKLAALEDIDIVCIPGQTDALAQATMVDWAEKTRRFAILDTPRPGDPATHVTSVRGTNDHAGHAALYYPWLRVRHPHSGQSVFWPPCGHVAGIYARTDQRGVWVAPANEPVLGATGLAERLTDAEQAPLNLAGVNVLRVFAGTAQPIVWGARTTTDPDRNRTWQYISTRRLFLYLEKSIERGIRSAIFAPNNPELWARLRRTISDFLTKTYQDGAFGGLTTKDSFYVRIDEALNPEPERILGRLYLEIGVRPAYPAEFIVMRIGIWDGGSSVEEP
jgi:hypothetical protein